jgi:hypothetical protein
VRVDLAAAELVRLRVIDDSNRARSPIGFYLNYGFARTGQVFEGEDVLALATQRDAPQPC